jgi:integrase
MKRKLTDSTVKNAKTKPDGKPAKFSDGDGLYLLVTTVGKYWRYNYRINGIQKTLALGVYPETTLKQARDLHDDSKAVLARGVDPVANKKAQRAARVKLTENSFEVVAREWLVKFSDKWIEEGKQRITSRLERDIFPWVGNRPIAEIEPPEILACLHRIEKRGALDTAHRAKQDCGQIFRYAVATGRAYRDPTPDLKGALPTARKQHFAAITNPAEIGVLLRGMEEYKGSYVVQCALKLSALVFSRPGELRQMEWAEIDLANEVWELPADKMKMRMPHVVPLSRQALAILQDIQPLTGRDKYVFPSVRQRNDPMSENTIRQALRRLGYSNTEMTAHGFRAMARTVLEEVLDFPIDIIEHQLAHAVKDPNGRAYNRTKHLQKRATMMQRWADYLDELRATTGGDVIPFKTKVG